MKTGDTLNMGQMGRYCVHCSNPEAGFFVYHTGPCPYIKSVEYHENGTIKKIEYHDIWRK
jgi:hypothetical protein